MKYLSPKGWGWYHESKELVQAEFAVVPNEPELEVIHAAELQRSRQADEQREHHQKNTQRWQMLQAMQNADNIKSENEKLKEQLQEVSALANTTMVQSAALLRTINHLKVAWETEAPDSPVRQETVDNLNDHYKQHWQDVSADPKSSQAREQAIETAKNSGATKVRTRKTMRR